MKRKHLSISIMVLFSIVSLHAQNVNQTLTKDLNQYFVDYNNPKVHIPNCKLKDVEIDEENRTLRIYPSDTFGYQPFTPELVNYIYKSIQEVIPQSYKRYTVKIISDDRPIEDLVPNLLLKKKDKSRLWGKIDNSMKPWTFNASRPYKITNGLEGRHIALWQSHGIYYKNDAGKWTWQRPHIFCTTEDLFTQSFVVPYLIPMLQNAGAIVFTPRERDYQRNEIIVDNDAKHSGCVYFEEGRKKGKWTNAPFKGFANYYSHYEDGQNPFETGTARMVKSTKKKKKQSIAEWIPNIPETGSYAVYVSYQSLPNSVTDAHYTIFHKGGTTEFLVNQRIGGGTWVYLGTFEFEKGNKAYGLVALSNESSDDGIITADAVRFGGGMGNIVRGGSVSGMPRFLEGARYYAQWSGMPYDIYSGKEGTNDYADDINVRSKMSNYLSGGSPFNPTEKGLGVPLELSIGIHSDAGYSRFDEKIGTLGIYTTQFNNGKLNAGISRYTSRDFCDIVMSSIQRDLSIIYKEQWTRRAMWNRNYSETRLPAVPSMILEMLSHQNFADMKLGHDPKFKFVFSRAVYKAILRYITSQHDDECIIQPLPVNQFAIRFADDKGTVRLSWDPVSDPLEPTATANEYIVYTRIGHGGFDNGEKVSKNSFDKQLKPGLIYSFKITAVNKGGESFPSETLTACFNAKSRKNILIVNGFNRVSGPVSIETASMQGFDMDADPGVPDRFSAEYCGRQISFDRSRIGYETPDGLGYSTGEWEGKSMAGNSFDYPFIHGKAILASSNYSFVSCSLEAILNRRVNLQNYPIADFIFGVEKAPFTPSVRQLISSYISNGGRVLLSGANLSEAVSDPGTQSFAERMLHFLPNGNMHHSPSGTITGTGIQFNIWRQPNEVSYAVPSPSSINPTNDGAFCAFAYNDGLQCAGIAFRNANSRTFVLGFPFESVILAKDRSHIMSGILNFLQ